jgi:hypothetical protein
VTFFVLEKKPDENLFIEVKILSKKSFKKIDLYSSIRSKKETTSLLLIFGIFSLKK